MRAYLISLFVALVIGFAVLKSPTIEPLVDGFCLSLAQVSGGIIGVFDGAVVRDGAVLYRGSYGYAIEVTKVCNALEQSLVLAMAICLLPLSWPQRLAAVAASFVFLQSLNVLRLISLVYGKVLLSPDHFDFLHLQIFVVVLAVAVVLFFIAFLYQNRHRLLVVEGTTHG
ncbi:MAG: exosortase/archaeosortase family protein [Pseudomonadota bacterium]